MNTREKSTKYKISEGLSAANLGTFPELEIPGSVTSQALDNN